MSPSPVKSDVSPKRRLSIFSDVIESPVADYHWNRQCFSSIFFASATTNLGNRENVASFLFFLFFLCCVSFFHFSNSQFFHWLFVFFNCSCFSFFFFSVFSFFFFFSIFSVVFVSSIVLWMLKTEKTSKKSFCKKRRFDLGGEPRFQFFKNMCSFFFAIFLNFDASAFCFLSIVFSIVFLFSIFAFYFHITSMFHFCIFCFG